jgi:hypothetical protein
MHNQMSVKHNEMVKKAPPVKKPSANWDTKHCIGEPAKQCLNKHLDQNVERRSPTKASSVALRCQ